MPGLRLSFPEAAKLLGVRDSTAAVVLEDLVSCAALERTREGYYILRGNR